EGGTVERVVAAAVLRHGGKRGAFVLERGAIVDRVAIGALRRRKWCAGLAARLAVGLAADLDPAGAPHDLACLGDKAMRQWFVNQRQMFVRDVEEVDVLLPAVRLLCRFVDALGDELLTVSQYLDLVNDVIGCLEGRADLLERRRTTERDQ